MTQRVDVCIRGAGIVGRTLALLLAQQRLRVALVVPPVPASAAAPAPDIRAYALNAQAKDALTALRCWPEGEAVTPVTAMHVSGDEGASTRLDAATAWIVDVPVLEAKLQEATRYQPQIHEVNEAVPAPLTVVCEGKFSATRAELGVEMDSLPYAQHAVAARLDCEWPHGALACQWFNQGEILAFLPMGGPQGRRVALVWSLSAERADAVMAMNDADFAAAVQAAGQCQWGAMTVQPGTSRGRWPLVQRMAHRWCGRFAPGQGDGAAHVGGSWVLAGDAAHTVHPLAGQGLNLGLADAIELARVLNTHDGGRSGVDYWRGVGDMRLLRRYERTRRAQMAPLAAAMDGIQRLFAVQAKPVQTLRTLGLRQFDQMDWAKQWAVRLAAGQA